MKPVTQKIVFRSNVDSCRTQSSFLWLAKFRFRKLLRLSVPRTAAVLAAILGLSSFNQEVIALERPASWNTDVSGLWADSQRWTTSSYPDNSGTNLYGATINVPSRTVTLDRNITIERLSMVSGALEGTNNPTLMLNQQLHLGAAKLIREGLLSANGMTITGATKIVHGWTLENRGVGNWLEGDFHVGEGFRFYNSSIAGFNANFDGTISTDVGGGALFENAGMFRKSAGTNQTKMYIPFLNTGNVEVDSGELAFYSNSTNIGGKVEILPDAALTFLGIRHTFDAGSKIYGQGNILFNNGTVDFDGTMDVKGLVTIGIGTVNITPTCTVTQLGNSLLFAQSGTLNLNSGETIGWNSLTMSNGLLYGSDDVVVTNAFQWRGGTLRGTGHLYLNAGAQFAGAIKTFRGWTIENQGPIQWAGGDVYTGEGCRFVNNYGASIQNSFDGQWAIGHSGGSVFENDGVFQKTAGTNMTWINATVQNEGMVEVDSGTFRFAGALTNRGALAVAAGAKFSFQSANIYLTPLGSLDGDGSVVLESGFIYNSGSFRAGAGVTLNSGTLRFTNTTSRPNFGTGIRINGVSTLDLNSGYSVSAPILIQTNGTVQGADSLTISNLWVCNNGDLDGSGLFELRGQSLINGGPRWTGRRLVNYGDMTWSSGEIDAGIGFVLHNKGVFYVNCDRNFYSSYGGTTAFLNEGTFRKDSSGTNTINLPFNNNAQVFVNIGRLQFNGGFTQTNGLLALNGTAMGSSKPIVLHGGTLAGWGDIFGTVSNAGTMTVAWWGNTGSLKITGNCTQTVSATLQMDIATNGCDSLNITGSANLNGNLEINLVDGFVPQDGATFPILTCGTRVGQFAQVTGTSLPNGRKLVPVYSATGVSLLVSNTLAALQLSIESVPGTNAVKVSWPDGYTGYTLQSSTNLAITNWFDIPVTNSTFVIVPATAPAQFFRLMNSGL